jgi:hypothetical protein
VPEPAPEPDEEPPAGAAREIARIGERLMLLGLRRVVVIGGTPALLKLLREGIDPRIDLRLRGASGKRTRADAEVDVTRTDAVVLWGVAADPDAAGVYQTSRAVVVEVAGTGLAELIAEVNLRLDQV